MFSTKSFSLVLALAALQLVAVQGASLSDSCQTTLASIATSSDGNCLNAGGLISLLSANADQDLTDSIDSWAKGMCGRSACTNATISSISTSVVQGCSTDLAGLGLQNVDAGELASLVQQFYPTVREVVCLADTKNGSTLCVTESLKDLVPVIGPISTTNLESLVTNALSGQFPNIPSNVTCTDCSKAAFSLINKGFSGLVPSSVSTDLSSQCGASFVDGAMPSSVTQLASSSSVTVSPSGAAPAFGAVPVFGLVGASLVAVASAFAVLA